MRTKSLLSSAVAILFHPRTAFMGGTSMVYAMDTLGYAKRPRDAGVPQQQAEARSATANVAPRTSLRRLSHRA
jgi:hypothetical protein